MKITLKSACDLNNAGILSKTKAFAVAWISNNDKSRQWTGVDNDNGTNPTWNQVMNFLLNEADLQQGCLLLEIGIYSDTTFGDKELGRVSIPLKEFFQHAGSKKCESATAQFVSYQVRNPSGKPKGVLHLSVILTEKAEFKQQQEPLQAVTESYGVAKAEPLTAYPVGLNEGAKLEPVTEYPGYPPVSSSSYLPANDQYPPPPYPSHAGYPPPPPPPPYHGHPPPPPPYHGYPPPPPPYHGYPRPPPPPPYRGRRRPPPPPPYHGHPPPPYHGYPPYRG